MKAIKLFLACLACGIVGLILLAILFTIFYIVMFVVIPDIFAVMVYAFFIARLGLAYFIIFLLMVGWISVKRETLLQLLQHWKN